MKVTRQELTTILLWISVIAFMAAGVFGYIAAKAKLEESAKQQEIEHQKELRVMASNLVRGMIEAEVGKALDKELVRQLSTNQYTK